MLFAWLGFADCLGAGFWQLLRSWHSGQEHAVQGPGLAVSCAALVLALAGVWLLVFCLRIGKTVGSTQFFLFVSGMSADIYIYWSFLITHIDAIALCWFARLNSFSASWFF